jgi:MYXO-CTERM domain-containing protein
MIHTALALSTLAVGWLPTGFAWNPGQFPISYCILSNATQTQLTQAQVRTEIERAINYWRSTGAGGGTSCTTFDSRPDTRTCRQGISLDTQQNIYFERNWQQGSQTLGVTHSGGVGNCGSTTDDTGTRTALTCQNGPDIELNDANICWDSSGRSCTDIASIVTHEYGHLLGLDHCNDNGTCTQGRAVMYAAYIGGQIRPPFPDDTQGVCTMYPGTPGGIGFPCTAAGQCTSGMCVAPGASGYCTATCGTCPGGYACDTHQQFPGQMVCVRDDGTNKDTCEVCQGGLPNACANSGLCIAGIPEQDLGRCAPPCPNPNAPDGACPNLFTCVNIQGAGPYCIPRSSDCNNLNNFTELQMGQTCNGNPPCATGLECVSICTQACTGPGGQGSCPSGFACETFNFQTGPESYCAPPVREGEDCNGFVACPTGPCLRTGTDPPVCYLDCAGNAGVCNNAQDCNTYGLSGGGTVSICEPAGVPPRTGTDAGPNPLDSGPGPGEDAGPVEQPDGGPGPGQDATAGNPDATNNTGGSCTCDQFYYCEPGCDCDQECPCLCDETYSCDQSCMCDPECYGPGGTDPPKAGGTCGCRSTSDTSSSAVIGLLTLGVLLGVRRRRILR